MNEIDAGPFVSKKVLMFPRIGNVDDNLSPTRRGRKPLKLLTAVGRSVSISIKKSRLGSNNRVYKYKLLPGNNGRVMLACLRKRPWWHATSKVDAATTDNDRVEELPSFIWEMYKNPKRYKDETYRDVMLNHIEHNNCLVTKKGLYLSLKSHCILNKEINLLNLIPRTYYLKSGSDDRDGDLKEFLEFNKDHLEITSNPNSNTYSNSNPNSNPNFQPNCNPNSQHNCNPNSSPNSSNDLRSNNDSVSNNSDESNNDSNNDSNSNKINGNNPNPDSSNRSEANDTAKSGEKDLNPNPNLTVYPPPKNLIWILKPASKTNRGFGITVVRGVNDVLNVVNRPESGKSKENKEGEKEKGGMPVSFPSYKEKEKDNRERKEEKERLIAKIKNSNKNIPETDDKNKFSSNVLSKEACRLGAQEGWIVQLYMDRPMLVSGRKFDIRCFVLVTNFAKQGLRAYFFKDAYVRTSSKKYSLTSLTDREAHLTNDAVQKNSKTYGKFEDGNKLSFVEWQETILKDYPHAPSNVVEDKFMPEIIRLSGITIAAVSKILCKTEIHKSFELLGYDYMVDDQFNVTLIEVNSNPCLEFVCPLLTDIISSLIENVVKVALDTQLPPPAKGSRTEACQEAITEIAQEETKFTQIYPIP